MKKYLLFAGILFLVSCKKKYEEKAGAFNGLEIMSSGTYDDTLTTDVSPANYNLQYDHPSRTYTVISSTGNLPAISFERKEFKENNATKATLIGGLGGWDVTLDGNKLTVFHETLTLSSWTTIAFEGEK
jgi:hypothetical protein